jgi:hypothetical protein
MEETAAPARRGEEIGGMFERIRRSWCLLGEAWEVLCEDRELVIFPIISGICSLFALASFAVPFLLRVHWGAISSGHSPSGHVSLGPWGYVWTFLYYLVTYFIVVFFNSGLVACVRIRLAGGDPTVQDGFAFATANVGRIFQWALLSATVGTVLRALEERAGWLGQIVISLIGMAWSLATAFVVPVLVHEQVGPFEAVKRSAQTFRRTWGETVVANIGLSWAFGLLFLGSVPLLILALIGGGMLMHAAPAAGAVVMLASLFLAVAYWLGLAIVQSTLQSIFLTACYQYATTGESPAPFTREYIVEAWRPKK